MKKAYIVAFSGPSNSGKTTLIEKLINHFKSSYTIAVIKHDPKDKARFDTQGKDSYRFYEAGASVAVLSPKRSTYILQEENSIKDAIKRLAPFDLLFIEGLRTLPYPRIVLFREEFKSDYLPYADAIAVHNRIDIKKYTIPNSLPVFDLDDINGIANWVVKNSKEIVC